LPLTLKEFPSKLDTSQWSDCSFDYLNEKRLRQIQARRLEGGLGGDWNRSAKPTWFRFAGVLLVLPIGLIIVFVLFYFVANADGFFPGEFLAILLIVS